MDIIWNRKTDKKCEENIHLYHSHWKDSLYEKLSLELTFKDYNNTEKIACLSDILDTNGEPVQKQYAGKFEMS